MMWVKYVWSCGIGLNEEKIEQDRSSYIWSKASPSFIAFRRYAYLSWRIVIINVRWSLSWWILQLTWRVRGHNVMTLTALTDYNMCSHDTRWPLRHHVGIMLHEKTIAVGTEHRVLCKRELEIDWNRSNDKILTNAWSVSSMCMTSVAITNHFTANIFRRQIRFRYDVHQYELIELIEFTDGASDPHD